MKGLQIAVWSTILLLSILFLVDPRPTLLGVERGTQHTVMGVLLAVISLYRMFRLFSS